LSNRKNKMPEFKDIGKASKDLFKKPFNAGKVDIDVKAGCMDIKTSVSDSFSAKLERKDSDALFGMVAGLSLPYKTIMDGKSIKMEISKVMDMNKDTLNFDFNDSYNIAAGSHACVLKTKYSGECALIAGTETSLSAPASTKFHATYPFKGITVGVAGSFDNPTALNYAFQGAGFALETDTVKYALHLHSQADANTAIACQANWSAGSADAGFGFAAKRKLASGADFHVKTNLAGAVDLAHVSNISNGVKMTLSTNFNSINFSKAAPTFGMGLEFNL